MYPTCVSSMLCEFIFFLQGCRPAVLDIHYSIQTNIFKKGKTYKLGKTEIVDKYSDYTGSVYEILPTCLIHKWVPGKTDMSIEACSQCFSRCQPMLLLCSSECCFNKSSQPILHNVLWQWWWQSVVQYTAAPNERRFHQKLFL